MESPSHVHLRYGTSIHPSSVRHSSQSQPVFSLFHPLVQTVIKALESISEVSLKYAIFFLSPPPALWSRLFQQLISLLPYCLSAIHSLYLTGEVVLKQKLYHVIPSPHLLLEAFNVFSLCLECKLLVLIYKILQDVTPTNLSDLQRHSPRRPPHHQTPTTVVFFQFLKYSSFFIPLAFAHGVSYAC